VNVLIACEFSGIVRTAFERKGAYAVSCDLLPTKVPGNHYQGDVKDILYDSSWDLIIAHPPCTALCVSGNRWYSGTQEREVGLEFFSIFLDLPAKRVCIENPVGVVSSRLCKPTQYIQPWQFGHGETKKTGLWLKNLPQLTPTNIVSGREQRILELPPSTLRSQIRSTTYEGIAEAMATQWINLDS
jgi:site-specific DNA-cytosine methylase